MNASFYNGVSGIKTHQFGLDTWGNNIANINTVGYRANIPEFATIFATAITPGGGYGPTINDVGYGSRGSSSAISMQQGSIISTENYFDLAIHGKGWFGVIGLDGGMYYTRQGAFDVDKDGNVVDGFGNRLVDEDGKAIKLDWTQTIPAETTLVRYDRELPLASLLQEGETVPQLIERLRRQFPDAYVDQDLVKYTEYQQQTLPPMKVSQFIVRDGGVISAVFDVDETYEAPNLVGRDQVVKDVAKVGMFYFINEQGLAKEGDLLFSATSNSGEAMKATSDFGRIVPKELEASNVSTATALTELIVMQKAFEASARSITTSDQMIQRAINMKAGR
ncbi:MAG: flagellar hook-basal body complex protein [Campylobacterales bacterium]